MDTSSIQDGNATPPKRVRAEERRYQSEIMFIGQRCFWHECNREDFLPFRCADCQHQFCSEHFRNEQHQCPNPKPDFVVPQCPLCHEPPKGWKRDEDPNVAMDAHLSPNPKTGVIECSALTKDGKIAAGLGDYGLKQQKELQSRQKRDNECNERRCHKMMVVPIKCPQCSLQFCPSHRAPFQHQCASGPSSSKSPAHPKNKASLSAANTLLESLAAKRSNLQKQAQGSTSRSDAINNAESGKVVDKMESLNPIRALHTASNERKMDKWVPPPIFGKA